MEKGTPWNDKSEHKAVKETSKSLSADDLQSKHQFLFQLRGGGHTNRSKHQTTNETVLYQQ